MGKVSTDLLFHWARGMGINIVFSTLRLGNLGVADAAKNIIVLDVSLRSNPRLLRCVLAHELGHILFPPRPGHIRYHSTNFIDANDGINSIKVIVGQDERMAQDWSTGILMPDAEFNRVIETGNYSINEIAEMFEVEPRFVLQKIGYYRRKEESAGRMVPKWRDLIRRD